MENIMDKLRAWVVKHKFIAVLLILFLVPFICIYKPYKATNPANPLFVESWFSLSDYNFRHDSLSDAVKKLLPVGTNKARADLILVNNGGAEYVDNNSTSPGYYSYLYYPIKLSYNPSRIDVYVDQDNKIVAVLHNRKLIVGDFSKIQKK